MLEVPNTIVKCYGSCQCSHVGHHSLLTVIACFPKVRDMISRGYRTNDIHNNNRGGKWASWSPGGKLLPPLTPTSARLNRSLIRYQPFRKDYAHLLKVPTLKNSCGKYCCSQTIAQNWGTYLRGKKFPDKCTVQDRHTLGAENVMTCLVFNGRATHQHEWAALTGVILRWYRMPNQSKGVFKACNSVRSGNLLPPGAPLKVCHKKNLVSQRYFLPHKKIMLATLSTYL